MGLYIRRSSAQPPGGRAQGLLISTLAQRRRERVQCRFNNLRASRASCQDDCFAVERPRERHTQKWILPYTKASLGEAPEHLAWTRITPRSEWSGVPATVETRDGDAAELQEKVKPRFWARGRPRGA